MVRRYNYSVLLFIRIGVYMRVKHSAFSSSGNCDSDTYVSPDVKQIHTVLSLLSLFFVSSIVLGQYETPITGITLMLVFFVFKLIILFFQFFMKCLKYLFLKLSYSFTFDNHRCFRVVIYKCYFISIYNLCNIMFKRTKIFWHYFYKPI